MHFVTLTNHRSGSSHFQRLLNSHPEIKARQEDLRHPYLRTEEYLDEMYEGKTEHFGIKIMYTHLNDEVISFLKRDNIKVIQLIRNNILETALWMNKSFEGNRKGGMGSPLRILGKGRANIPLVIERMLKIHKWVNKYRSLADFTVYYETAYNGCHMDGDLQKRIYDFFDVKDKNKKLYSEENKKNEREPSSELVLNYDELLQELKKNKIPLYYDSEFPIKTVY